MKIGTVLNIEMKDPETNDTQKYRCKLFEMSNHYLIIDYPISLKTNRTTFLPKGKIIRVSFLDDDQAVYQFDSKVVKHIKSKVPTIAISFPEKDKIKRIQRRQFVRINTAIDVSVHSVKGQFTPLVTVTSDISGGGLSVIIPKSINPDTFKIGDKVNVWMVLIMHSGEYHYISVRAEIVFIKNNNRVNSISLKFINIERADQQQIIRYCFEKQRKARQKELQ